MARGPIYIISHNGQYLTNRTNAKRLWELIEEIFGEREIEICYRAEEGDTEYTVIPARYQKLKSTCQIAHRNRIVIREADDQDIPFNEWLTIMFDQIGGEE